MPRLRIELYVGYLGTLGDLLSDLFYLLFGRNLSLNMTLAAIPFTMENTVTDTPSSAVFRMFWKLATME